VKALALKGAIVVVLVAAGWHEVAVHHLGAPPLPYTCPAGDTVYRHWVPGTNHDWPGSLTYDGWTEYASCQASLTITGS
jgi:hypothetical protein